MGSTLFMRMLWLSSNADHALFFVPLLKVHIPEGADTNASMRSSYVRRGMRANTKRAILARINSSPRITMVVK